MTAMRAIFVVLSTFMMSNAASAQVIRIECGETWYSFHPANNVLEMVNRNDSVDWQYDGEWLRLTSRTDGSRIAFSSKNGYRLTDGNQEAVGCVFDDPGQLALLPVSKGAQLRLAFLALSEDQRKAVQSELARESFYTSNIDGLWGSGTERAIFLFIEAVEVGNSEPLDPSTQVGASAVLSRILMPKVTEDTCTDCSSRIATALRQEQASIFKHAEIDCREYTSFIDRDGGQRVADYIYQSGTLYRDDVATQRRLQTLLLQYPRNPLLNWQAGYLSFLRNDFESTINHLKIAASQGEPNAAYIIGYIAMGLLDGNDSLKPDETTMLKPVDLRTAAKCLHAVVDFYNRDVILERMEYTPAFADSARELLAALYLHDVDYIFSSGANDAEIMSHFGGIAYDPRKAIELVGGLGVSFAEIKIKAEHAMRRLEAENRRQEEERQRRHEDSLKASEAMMSELERKCEGYSTIRGVCWSLTQTEMRSVLATRGYRNNPEQPNIFTDPTGASISIKGDFIEIQCGVLNACDLSIRELAARVQNSGLVEGAMEFDAQFSGGLIDGVYSNTNSFCGRGLKGEKICVVEANTTMGFTFTSTYVVLSKGIVGEDISFD